jgi:hypothetical protein
MAAVRRPVPGRAGIQYSILGTVAHFWDTLPFLGRHDGYHSHRTGAGYVSLEDDILELELRQARI